MRKRHNGFTNFMRKLEGETNNDNFSETEGLGSELYSRYGLLLGVLRGERSWSSYMQEIMGCSIEERRACYTLRKYLRINIPSYPLGVYFSDGGSAYRKAIEYLREHQESEQQERVSSGTHRPVSLGNTDDLYIRQIIWRDLLSPSSSS
jgi:hypothetical protein